MCPKTGALMVLSVFVLRDYRLFSFKFFFHISRLVRLASLTRPKWAARLSPRLVKGSVVARWSTMGPQRTLSKNSFP